jgi:hypothetical protein
MKVEVYVSTNKVGSRIAHVIDVPDEDLEGCTEEERNNYLDEYCSEYVLENLIEWGWHLK